MGRIIIFTGKGGVGKSTIACANGVKASQEGLKTLIVSTDMAHNLGDIFEIDIKEEPVLVSENLYAIEINPNHEMERNYENIKDAVKKMMPALNNSEGAGIDVITAIPGIEELLSLLRIKEFYDSNKYNLIIVDCAPTGETLSLLKLPELLSWYFEKLFPIGKISMKILRPVSKSLFKMELPNTETLNDIENLYVKLRELDALFKDRNVCSIRIVTVPEKMIVEETKRNYMYCNLYNFNVDALYINRILDDNVNNDFFNEWKKMQKEYLQVLNDSFNGINIFKIKWYGSDINGYDYIKKVSEDSLTQKNMFNVLKSDSNEVYEKNENGYNLKINIPFADKDNFDLSVSSNDLIIKIGNFKRNVTLPDVLKKYEVTHAKLDSNILCVKFEEMK